MKKSPSKQLAKLATEGLTKVYSYYFDTRYCKSPHRVVLVNGQAKYFDTVKNALNWIEESEMIEAEIDAFLDQLVTR